MTGLFTHFDMIDNEGTGVHNPNATILKDLAGGRDGVLQGGATYVGGNAIKFKGNTGTGADRVAFQGYIPPGMTDYTISFVFELNAKSGSYPRIMSEPNYPGFYFHSAASPSYPYSHYAIGKDTFFTPNTAPSIDTIVQITMRYTHATKLLECFENGIKTGEITGVPAPAATTTAYFGNRAAGDRALNGKIFKYMFHSAWFTQDQIMNNVMVDAARFGITL